MILDNNVNTYVLSRCDSTLTSDHGFH